MTKSLSTQSKYGAWGSLTLPNYFNDKKIKTNKYNSFSSVSSSKKNPAVREGEKLVKKHVVVGDKTCSEITQGRYEQWCADAVNYIYTKAYGKDPFGVDKSGKYLNSNVLGLKKWGIDNSRYYSAVIPTDIKQQLKQFSPGDVVIFKSKYTVPVEGGKKVTRHASHTGIVKEVKNGKVVVLIEGNANIYRTNNKGERFIVHNDKEGKNGNQAVGDFQEVNPHDGVIEKSYDVKSLQEHGYSGFIDMTGI